MPLSGRERMEGRGDGAADIDVDAAGIGIGSGLVLRIEQRLEGRVCAAGLEVCRYADAGEETLPTQAVTLRDQRGIVGARKHLVDPRLVVAPVLGGAARVEAGKLGGAHPVPPP